MIGWCEAVRLNRQPMGTTLDEWNQCEGVQQPSNWLGREVGSDRWVRRTDSKKNKHLMDETDSETAHGCGEDRNPRRCDGFSLVVRGGIEPPTPGFSDRCSTS
jgi:hypothetical protein